MHEIFRLQQVISNKIKKFFSENDDYYGINEYEISGYWMIIPLMCLL